MNTKTVWVIEQGTYSDYHVVGVFTSKENAEFIASKLEKSYDEPTIAEWDLDPAVTELRAGMQKWYVLMLIDGTVERCETRDFSAYGIGEVCDIWERTKAIAYKGKGIPDAMQCEVWAESQKHAIKIANERRTQMIAKGEWK